MGLRQEQIVFAAALLVLGGLGYGLMGSDAAVGLRGGGSGGAPAELVHYRAPDAAVALPNASVAPLARELFSPPSDTSPLPPLELVEPPRERLPLLLPPTDPGPAPRAYGKLLRRKLPLVDLPDLFAKAEEAPGADVASEAAPATKQALVPSTSKAKPDDDPFAGKTPEEREAMIAEWKRRYDWIQRGPGELLYGRIVNPDRYGLGVDPARANEALSFVQLRPETGREWLTSISAPPLVLERATIVAFDFAGTVANEVEVSWRRLGGELTRSSFEQALVLARHCIDVRLAAPRALAIAEDLYRRAAQYDPKDPEPRLGLARCLEASFRFEDAFNEYQALLETFGHREEVHVAMAELEERFLLHDQAEARLRQALAMNQSSWISRFGLGRFLVHRGRNEEAVEHLKVANQNAPQAPELLPVRVAIRTTLADAYLALGQLSEADAQYSSALAADKNYQRALAGSLATRLYAGKDVAVSATAGEDAGFELLLARGVADMASGKHQDARDALNLAAAADPLRAHEALAALSVLAELTGNGEEAQRFADEALERDPADPFALFQKGRLLGLQDDYEGARAALLAALEQELDFEDALVALGEMAFRLGRFEDAERYLERAVSIEEGRADVHALRGLNLLRLNAVAQARESFERALALVADDPTANAGLAWCQYLEGDPDQAVIRLANIDERRRGEPDTDPWRVWSKAQIERLKDHLQKVEWRDTFTRKRLANQWVTRESSGPTVSVADGAAEIAGVFNSTGDARVFRSLNASDFVSFAADVWITPGKDNVRVGIFAARERELRNSTEVIAEASVSRHKEGNVQLRFVRSGQAADVRDMKQAFPTGKWVRLQIERFGESSEATVTLSMDGIPLAEHISMPPLAQTKSPLLVGVFVEGETGRPVDVRLDNVSMVTKLGL